MYEQKAKKWAANTETQADTEMLQVIRNITSN